MNVKQITPLSAIYRQIDEHQAAYRRYMMREFAIVGEQCVNVARSEHPNNWTDRTGNLRSSIGYVIVMDGKVVAQSSFAVVAGGQEGATKGKNFAMKLAERFPRGIALIVVAGMEYAVHVANLDYDVLDSAEILAARLLKQFGITKTEHLQ